MSVFKFCADTTYLTPRMFNFFIKISEQVVKDIYLGADNTEKKKTFL